MTAPHPHHDVLRQIRNLMATASTSGTGFPNTPAGEAFVRGRWVVQIMEALYDEAKFGIGCPVEVDSLGQLLTAAYDHEARMREWMWPEDAPAAGTRPEHSVHERSLDPSARAAVPPSESNEEVSADVERVRRLLAASSPARPTAAAPPTPGSAPPARRQRG